MFSSSSDAVSGTGSSISVIASSSAAFGSRTGSLGGKRRRGLIDERVKCRPPMAPARRRVS